MTATGTAMSIPVLIDRFIAPLAPLATSWRLRAPHLQWEQHDRARSIPGGPDCNRIPFAPRGKGANACLGRQKTYPGWLPEILDLIARAFLRAILAPVRTYGLAALSARPRKELSCLARSL